MKNWPVKKKLFVYGGVCLFLAVFIGTSGLLGITQTDHAMEKIVETSKVLEKNLQADMMHDTLRADVFHAMLVAEGNGAGSEESVIEDVKDHAAVYRSALSFVEEHNDSPDIDKEISLIKPPLDKYIEDAQKIVQLAFVLAEAEAEAEAGMSEAIHKFEADFEILEVEMGKLSELISEEVMANQVIGDSAVVRSKMIISAVLAISLILVLLGANKISNAVAIPLQEIACAVQKVAEGDYSIKLSFSGKDEIGILGRGINAMAEKVNNASAGQAREIARAKAMVEFSSENIMFVNEDLVLEYMNPMSFKTLRKIEHLLPIKADDMIGTCIDTFHKNPGRIRKILADPNNLPHQGVIELGDEVLNLTAAAVFDDGGNRIGSMATWALITEKARLEKSLNETIVSIAAAAEELNVSSKEMRHSATTTTSQAETVERVSTDTNGSVQSVAAAADELTVTVREISKNVQEANQITEKAVSMAGAMNQTINKLDASSTEIGKVIKVISTIAGQTNLLALNATIEAARAGDAGKGFAVVANEVKDLAKGTSEATEQIRHQIKDIQSNTQEAVAAITEISEIIRQNSEISTTIASAVEEQSATTGEISRNMSDAAQATEDVARNIGDIMQGAQVTTSAADNISGASEELSKMSGELANIIKQHT